MRRWYDACMSHAHTRSSRRRRILIGIAMAALFIAIAWHLSRPQIDSRLVGKWSLHDGKTTWPITIYELAADGSGAVLHPLNQQSRNYSREPILWRTEKRTLVCWRLPLSVRDVIQITATRLRSRFGGPRPSGQNTFELVEVHRNEVQADLVTQEGARNRWILQRISD